MLKIWDSFCYLVKRNDYLDHIVLDTLGQLFKTSEGLRFTELKTKLNVSDTSLVNRLNKLKDAKYIAMNANTSNTGRSYITYTLTQSGINLVHALNVPALLKELENQLA